MTKIKIEDSSGDKKYFTIIPNYIYNHSTLYDREVYCQMKRVAGENGVCWKSQKNLANQCGISINRLKKSIEYLIEHKWIKFNGKKTIKTLGGVQEVNEYSISDLWKRNNDFYNKGVSSDDIPSSKGVSSDDARGITNKPKGVSPDDDKEEPIKNNIKEENSFKKNTEKLEQLKNDLKDKLSL